ncbi:MAG TPA: tetratricopeptide repeat protein [Pseudacidobacterium sp.]|nr:tetratricopeptide repeat protein [Pseudacidobacterium sp.]
MNSAIVSFRSLHTVREGVTPSKLNKEIFLLVALALTTSGVFVFTRTMAAREQQMEVRIARIWYEQGRGYMASGNIEKAIEAFRRSTAGTRYNRNYALALADALAVGNHNAEAQQLLLRLREADPENAEVNIYLARLASRQGEISDAVRYYQNALYGRWTDSRIDVRRRQLRIELIHFLLAHQERNLASSELLILETELPDLAPSWIEAAKLYIEAGNIQHALKDYSEASLLDSHNVEALTGAGETSFQLGDYRKAKQYLKASLDLDPQSEKARQLLSITEMVLADDPLTPHLTAEERQRRLIPDFARTLQRLENCLNQNLNSKNSAGLQSLKAEALAMEPTLNRPEHLPDSDKVGAGMGLIFRMQKAASDSCGEPSAPDQALILIGLQHNGARL